MISRAWFISIFFALCVSGVSAHPADVTKSDGDVRTRGSLVRELEAFWERCEADHVHFVTKSEMVELKTLLLQIKEEMLSQSQRVDTLESGSETLKNRVEHTARPGF